MLNRIYWLITAAVLAVAVHAAYMLTAPSFALERSLARASDGLAVNRFQVLAQRSQAEMFPTFPSSSVFGVCLFDVSKSGVEIAASLPESFWTLAVYSMSGEVIYSINSQQSGTNSFAVSLTRAPGFFDMLTQSEPADPNAFNGWTVSTVKTKGIAVFWIPAPEPAQRASFARVLEKSSCRATA